MIFFIGFNLLYSQSFYIFASPFITTIHIDKSKTFQKKDMNEESYQQQPFNTIQHNKSMIEPTKTETEMKARAYGRTELAMMYCPQDTPGAAWRKLRQWTEQTCWNDCRTLATPAINARSHRRKSNGSSTILASLNREKLVKPLHDWQPPRINNRWNAAAFQRFSF